MFRTAQLLLLLLLSAPLAGGPARAEEAVAVGSAGAAGDPGQPGGPGEDGAPATAIADAPGEDNTAEATGGDGGAGGRGGDAVPAGSTPVDGAPGGDGGVGGDATARAIGTDAAMVSATALAGRFGFGGAGGAGANGGAAGAAGPNGVGGDALAEATLETDRPDAVSASATATHPGFDVSIASTAGAVARATNAGAGSVEVTAHAQAEFEAASEAYGSNSGLGAVNVSAVSESKSGRASATSEGHSTGGGDVNVAAALTGALVPYDVSTGGASLHDAVRGSTSGHLRLEQEINGQLPGVAIYGDVSSSLVATNPGGGDLSLSVSLFSREGDAILGDVIGTSTTGADVSVAARVGTNLGSLFLENRNGSSPPTPSRVYGASNGGDVEVLGSFARGLVDDPNGGFDGGSLDLDNAVSGDTDGALSLQQHVRGGAGQPDFYLTGEGGAGGSARSALSKQAAASVLTLRAVAEGGAAATAFPNSFPLEEAGDAVAWVDGSNSAGPVDVTSYAFGGGGETSRAGDAMAEASARSTGDGHDVTVGLEGPFESPAFGSGARGGSAVPILGPLQDASYGDGGDARSTSTGIAEGDSRVTVFDGAVGGTGGSTLRSIFDPSPPPTADGGIGGDASSTATAIGAGSSEVLAKANALGGWGGGAVTTRGAGGDAEATADAKGLGVVSAWGRAVGGNSTTGPTSVGQGPPGLAGSARATASATGATGFARAEAQTGISARTRTRALSEASLGGSSQTAAVATYGGALSSAPGDPGLEALVFLTGAPLAADADHALASNTAAAALFAANPGSAWLALGRWQGTGRDAGEGSLSLATELEIQLAPDDPTARLYLAAFDVTVLGDAFQSLDVALERDGAAIGDAYHFDTGAEVLAFFDDTALDLSAFAPGDTLLARFDLVVGEQTEVGMGIGFAAIVPEPATGSLLGLGLAALTRARRRARG